MKKILIVLTIIISSQVSWAQQELNEYKYIIVPKHFDFQTGADSYKINSLTKFLLDKKGLTTIFGDEVYPDDLKNNQCLALKANLLMTSSFTRTTILLSFTNCDNKTIYTSSKGISKLKDYKKSYHEAIRNAFKSLDKYKYNYTPKKTDANKYLKNNKVKVVVIKEVKTKTTPKPVVKEKNIKPDVVKAKKETKFPKKVVKSLKKIKKEQLISGLYSRNNVIYEISAFHDYYIFVKREISGNSFKSKPLGFIHKTSKKGKYLVKTSGSFTGYLKDNGDFIIEKIADNGSVESVIYKKTNN